MVRFIPFFVLSEHCVQDSQQLAHTGNQRHFFGFSGCKQTHVKRLYHRIKPGCHKSCHVQGCSCPRSTAKNGSSTAHGSRVPVYRSNTYKCTDFTSREVAQFWHFCQQCSSRHGANTFDAAQTFSKLFKMTLNVPVHIFIDPGKFILQSLDDDINAFSALRMCRMQTVTLSHQHGNQLASAYHHCSKHLTFEPE